MVEAGPGAFYVWSAAAAERLRTRHRIMGEWVGCASNHTSQNQFLSLPLALSRYEVAAGVLAGFLQLHPRPADAYAAVDDAHVQVFMAEREAAAAEQRQQEERQTEMRRLRFMAEEEMRLRRRRRREGARADAGREVGVDGGGRAPKRQRVGNADGQAQWLPRWWWWRWTMGWLPALERPLAGIAHAWTAIWRPWTLGKDGTSAASPMSPDANQSSAASQCPGSSSSRQAAERPPRPYHVRVRRERAPYEPLDARRAKVLRATELRRSPAWQSTLRSSQFVVFRDLWRRGFYLTNGNKFGADFLAYAHDPCLFHAGLCIIVLEARTVLHPRDMISLGRLGVATKKRAVLAHVSDAQRERVAYHGIAWCEQLP